MSRLGIGEITLVTLILLVLAPDAVPKLMRKVGQLVASLQKMSKEVNDQIVAPILGERADANRSRGGPRRERPDKVNDRPEENSAEKLRSLDRFVSDYQAHYADQALPWTVDDDPHVRDRARDALLLDPLFAFERRRLRRVDEEPSRPLSYLEQFFRSERVAALSDILSRVPNDRLFRNMESLSRLPGIESLDLERAFLGSKEDLKGRFLQLCSRFEHERYPLQVMVAPTYRCNLSCRYCFAHTLDRKFPREMTGPEFGEVLDKAVDPPVLRRVGLLGGEPIFSDHIEEYVDEIEKRNLSFYFATNGLTPTQSFRRIVRSNRLEAVTFHIEKDSFYGPGQIDLLLANIAAINQDRVSTFLRYNLTDKDFRDWSFMQKFLRRLNRPRLNFAVVFPSRADTKTSVSLQELGDFRPKILSLIHYLVETTESRGRTISFAKPYPLCLFEPEELQFLLRSARLRNVCEIDRNKDTNNVCVNPDGSFFPCMALNSEDFRFPRFEGRDNLGDRYHETIRKMIKTPLLPQCQDCLLHTHGVCQAACYAYL